jgi:riboflavin synthase
MSFLYLALMFTGIVEAIGTVLTAETDGTNKIFWISSSVSNELKIDQSVSHSGVCLTVDELRSDAHRVTAVAETLSKTNLHLWQPGSVVNLERCMQMNGRIDGHIVQGHADATAVCTERKDLHGSWEYCFSFDEQFAVLMIEKGSVCINGISLTAYNVGRNEFTVSIIPYTYEHTNIQQVEKDSIVNIEFDMIGKYINRLYSLQQNP